MRNTLLLSLSILLMTILNSCNDMEEGDIRYNFVGDSIINRWPLDECFPSQLVYNYGKSGAGVDYLEEYAGAFIGQDVVVMIGTNDNYKFYFQDIDNYVNHYLETISRLTDKTIYLYSVLPRNHEGDPSDVNSKISLFNDKIKSRLGSYPKIHYIDVFDEFLYKDDANPQYFADGLHPNIYGYEVLSSKLF